MHVACETHGALISSPCLAAPLPTLLLSPFPSSSSSSLPPLPSLPPSYPPPPPPKTFPACSSTSQPRGTGGGALFYRGGGACPSAGSSSRLPQYRIGVGVRGRYTPGAYRACSSFLYSFDFFFLIRTRLIFFFKSFLSELLSLFSFQPGVQFFRFHFRFRSAPLVPPLPKSLLLSWS